MSDDIKRCFADRVYLNASSAVARDTALFQNATIKSAYDMCLDNLVVSLTTYMHGIPSEKVHVYERYPSDWWQAFKERWFPKWLVRHFPVDYKEIYVNRQLYAAVCPHIHEKNQGTHLKWLAKELDAVHGNNTFEDKK